MRRNILFPKTAAARVALPGVFLALSAFGQSYTIVDLGTPGGFNNGASQITGPGYTTNGDYRADFAMNHASAG